jgi:hypothetical protein
VNEEMRTNDVVMEILLDVVMEKNSRTFPDYNDYLST